MPRSLKSKNRFYMAAVCLLDFLAYYVFKEYGQFSIDNWTESFTSLSEAIPVGAGLVVVGVINGLVPPLWKARLLYLRWTNPLPGCRAFTEHAHLDSRIDMHHLEKIVYPLPSEPRQQNALWYRWFKSVENDPGIEDAHQQFLLTRDLTFLSLLIVVIFGVLGLYQFSSGKLLAVLFLAFLTQMVICWISGRNYGIQLVTNVLALKASGR